MICSSCRQHTTLPAFGDMRINGVEITPEAIAQETQHHPAPAMSELLLQEVRCLHIEGKPKRDDLALLEAKADALTRMLLERQAAPKTLGD